MSSKLSLLIFTLTFLANVVFSSPRVPRPTNHVKQANCKKQLACGQRPGITSNITLSSSGVDRWYLITFPSNYLSVPSVPVIFSFHGGTRTAASQQALDQISNPEFNDFAITVYPQGINEIWQGIPTSTANDNGFVSDILDQLQENYCIDTNRIWATGKSDGAGFCNTLACDPVLSTKIAAFAPVSGAFYIDTLTCSPNTVTIPCNAARAVPMMEFHGGNDTTIAITGGERKGECLPSITHFIQEWAARDRLGQSNVTVPLTSDTVIYDFGTGRNFGLVRHVFDENIGHDWPSTVPNSDNTQVGHMVASFNATPIIIDWFKNHTLLDAGDGQMCS